MESLKFVGPYLYNQLFVLFIYLFFFIYLFIFFFFGGGGGQMRDELKRILSRQKTFENKDGTNLSKYINLKLIIIPDIDINFFKTKSKLYFRQGILVI